MDKYRVYTPHGLNGNLEYDDGNYTTWDGKWFQGRQVVRPTRRQPWQSVLGLLERGYKVVKVEN